MTMLNCVLGIDGGGTKTKCLLADLNGSVLGQGKGGPSNINQVSIEACKSSLRQAIWGAVATSSQQEIRLVSICCGMAGVASIESQELVSKLVSEILSENITSLLGAKRRLTVIPGLCINVCGDTVTTLFAGASQRHGIVAISGTGSIVYGETIDGRSWRAGGWGPFLSSEGSGYDIGHKAIRALVRSSDGRSEPTLLEPLILDRWELKEPNQIFHYAMIRAADISEIASLARIVNEAAIQGDRVARRILKEAGHDLFSGIWAVTTALHLENSKFPLVVSGGVLLNSALVVDVLVSRIARDLPLATVIKSFKDPANGALSMALQTIKNPDKIRSS